MKVTLYNTITDLYSLLVIQHLQYKFQEIVSLLWSRISDRKVAVSSVDTF